jgi:hypothetical protein
VVAVDLVDEQQRAAPGGAVGLGPLEHPAQVGHAREHRRQGLEGKVGVLR